MTLDNTVSNSLVSSADVNGTAVYSRSGDHVGTIDHLMIDKQSGKVAHAVMGFGGFLGLGEDFHPIPWGALDYDTSRDGFVTDITEDQLRAAPERPRDWHGDRAWEQRSYDHFGIPYYWI